MTVGHKDTIACGDIPSPITVGPGVAMTDGDGVEWCVHDDPRFGVEVDEDGVPTDSQYRVGLEGLTPIESEQT